MYCFYCSYIFSTLASFHFLDCAEPLGMESGDITDTNLYVSSGIGNGRFKLQAWEPVEEDTNPYMAISFPAQITITKLALLGSAGKYFSQINIVYSLLGHTKEVSIENVANIYTSSVFLYINADVVCFRSIINFMVD